MDMLDEDKFIGKKVKHFKFGEGIVTGYTRKKVTVSYIRIKFAGKEREFNFFDCVKSGILIIPDHDLLVEFYRIKELFAGHLTEPTVAPSPAPIPPRTDVLKVGDMWRAFSHVGMINKILGTNYKAWMKCWLKVKPINYTHTIAWFVYMDGSEHSGWRNNISADGLTIVERYVGNDARHIREIGEPNQTVIAFQLDPDGSGLKSDRYKCKFVGVFEQTEYDRVNLIRKYKRISDTYKIQLK